MFYAEENDAKPSDLFVKLSLTCVIQYSYPACGYNLKGKLVDTRVQIVPVRLARRIVPVT